MMDAAEIAGLECSFQCDGFLSHSETEQLIRGTKSLLDALEQAQKERNELEAALEHSRALLRWIADGYNPKSKPSSPQPAESGATGAMRVLPKAKPMPYAWDDDDAGAKP